MQNGAGTYDVTGFGYTTGGGLACQGESTVNLQGVWFTDNLADVGGAIATTDCALNLTETVFDTNTAFYGSALFAGEAAVVELTDSEVGDNQGSGAFYIYNGAQAGLHGVSVHDNEGSESAGLYLDGGSAICDSSASGASSTFSDNGLTSGGSALTMLQSEGPTPSFSADACAFGEWGAANDNHAPEITTLRTGARYVAGDAATFDCDADRCGESELFEVGTNANADNFSNYAYGEVFLADTAATLETSSFLSKANAGCALTYAVLTNTSSVSTGWATAWTGAATGALSTTDWVSSPQVNLITEPGTDYALLYGWSCATPNGPAFSTDLSQPDGGFGQAQAAFAAPIGNINGGSRVALGAYFTSARMHMRVSVTEL